MHENTPTISGPPEIQNIANFVLATPLVIDIEKPWGMGM